MSENKSILLRTLDHAFRVLNIVQGSQSTISPPLGDSVNLPDIYYVDSGNGSDGNDGRDPGFPMATIDAAINKCTDSQADVILVQPGHAETLTTQISLDVIGVSIIGIGEGALKPQITVAGVIDGIDIGAANCSVENIGFPVSTAGATSQVNIDAADAKVTKCTFHEGASDILGTVTITAAGERPTVTDNEVFVDANGPAEWVLFEGVVDRPVIKRNVVVCSDGSNFFDDAAINCAAVAVTNLVIKDNTFLGGGAAGDAIVGTGLVGAQIGPNEYSGGAIQGIVTPDGSFLPGFGYHVAKSAVRTSGAGADDLFDVTGQVLITMIYGEVTTVFPVNCDVALNEKSDSGPICAVTVLDSSPDGSIVMVTGDPGDALAGVAGSVGGSKGAAMRLVFDSDTIEATWTEIGTTGALTWHLYWMPLEPGASVVAAS